VSGDGSDSGGF